MFFFQLMAGVCKRTVAVWGGGVPVNSVNPVNPGESHMRPARVWVYIEGWVTGRVRFPNVSKLVTRERESEGELISPWVGLF